MNNKLTQHRLYPVFLLWIGFIFGILIKNSGNLEKSLDELIQQLPFCILFTVLFLLYQQLLRWFFARDKKLRQ